MHLKCSQNTFTFYSVKNLIVVNIIRTDTVPGSSQMSSMPLHCVNPRKLAKVENALGEEMESKFRRKLS